LGIGAAVHQIRRGQQRFPSGVAVAEAARIRQDGRIEARRDIAGRSKAHIPNQAEDQFRRRACQRIDQPRIEEAPVGEVVIDLDEVRNRPDPERLLPDPAQVAAIQDKGRIETFQGGEFIDDSAASREKKVISRRPVLIVDHGLLPQILQDLTEGQLGADGVPVGPFVRCDQKTPKAADLFANPPEHASPLPGGSPK